jgi:pimeloyl-ACP methyl ester carboxylesterase
VDGESRRALRALAHLRTGAGARPLVLLHGLLGSARNLSTLARHLAERRPDFVVVAFDLTGHGASAPLPATRSAGAWRCGPR